MDCCGRGRCAEQVETTILGPVAFSVDPCTIIHVMKARIKRANVGVCVLLDMGWHEHVGQRTCHSAEENGTIYK